LQDLGPVDEALTTKGNEVLLRVTPAGQCRRPFLGPGQIERVPTRQQHGAVHKPRGDRRHVIGGDPDHRLVEQRNPSRHLPKRDQRLPSAETTEGQNVRISEALADLCHPAERLDGARRIVTRQGPQPERNQQQAALRAVASRLVQQPPATGKPASAPSHLPPHEHRQAEPERTPGRPTHVSAVQPSPMSPSPERLALVVPAGQICRKRGSLEIRRPERTLGISGRELRVGISPRLPPERVPTPNQCTVQVIRLSVAHSPG
jgi:hypothetical protein